MWSAPVMFCHPSTGQIVRVYGAQDAVAALNSLHLRIPNEARARAYSALRRGEGSSHANAGRQAFADALAMICKVSAPSTLLVVEDVESGCLPIAASQHDTAAAPRHLIGGTSVATQSDRMAS